MPRMARMVLPNYPRYIVQRGHNRQVVFACADDFQRYLSDIRELKVQYGIKLYAWCLMTNHVHLLVSPEGAAGLGQFMKALAARATRYRNRLEGRTGTLWEGRYKSSIVDTEAYFLACCRYIAKNKSVPFLPEKIWPFVICSKCCANFKGAVSRTKCNT